MKQVVTNKSGTLEVVEVPAPVLRPGFVQVETRYSLISPGTEAAQVREGKAGLLTKVREHPDQVRQVLGKLRKEGVRAVAAQVRDKLQEWRSLGYSLSGVVTAVGEGVTDLAPGDRVACAGAGYAVHAEIVCVPRNLVARLPEGTDPRHAAFLTLGAIALHGVRRAGPALGEHALVIGLGLVGQLAAQLLATAGVRVAVLDPDAGRVDLARSLGADLAVDGTADPAAQLSAWTRGVGIDLALVCAATASSDPVHTASRLLRDRGRLIVVGDVGLELERGPLYRKELDFGLSRSYGPGRYDPTYEEGGLDYPVGYVRWTEGRNLEAVLDFLARGDLRVDALLREEVAVEDAPRAYQALLEGKAGLGMLLRYGTEPRRDTLQSFDAPAARAGTLGILLVGAGWFARTHHLPNLARQDRLRLAGVVSGTGANARQTAEKGGAAFAGTDLAEALARPEVDAVLLATRHHLHVPQTVAAIEAGKHVLVEKPLALDAAGLARIAAALGAHPVRLAVGFNRRFAPLARELRALLAGVPGPIHGTYRMNAGRLPREHWVNDPEEGGGRILGEACHAFDFGSFLTGSTPVTVSAARLRSGDPEVRDEDNLSATVTYADGSVLTVLYSTAGPKGYPKEQVEVFAPGLAASLTDFRRLVWSGTSQGKKTLRVEDKGQAGEMEAWARYLGGEDAGVADFQTAALSTWLTLQALAAARSGRTLEVASGLAAVLGGGASGSSSGA